MNLTICSIFLSILIHLFLKSAPGNLNYYTVKMNLINRALGTGHYLPSGGGGSEDFGGDYLIFRVTEGGISRN